ncbi:exotoxin type A domain protein [Streptococcus pyogenes GA06023]|nr:exotoxin type A domain protein [Streptococcus pyogenes GA06023]
MKNNKKVLKKIVYFVLAIFLGLTTSQEVFAQQDPNPSQLHRSSLVKNLQNIYFLYEGDPVVHENVKSVDQLLSHDLIYNVSGLNYDKLKPNSRTERCQPYLRIKTLTFTV